MKPLDLHSLNTMAVDTFPPLSYAFDLFFLLFESLVHVKSSSTSPSSSLSRDRSVSLSLSLSSCADHFSLSICQFCYRREALVGIDMLIRDMAFEPVHSVSISKPISGRCPGDTRRNPWVFIRLACSQVSLSHPRLDAELEHAGM